MQGYLAEEFERLTMEIEERMTPLRRVTRLMEEAGVQGAGRLRAAVEDISVGMERATLHPTTEQLEEYYG